MPKPASSTAYANSNGRFSPDRQFGLERAEERMSEQGWENQRATDNFGNPVRRYDVDIRQGALKRPD